MGKRQLNRYYFINENKPHALKAIDVQNSFELVESLRSLENAIKAQCQLIVKNGMLPDPVYAEKKRVSSLTGLENTLRNFPKLKCDKVCLEIIIFLSSYTSYTSAVQDLNIGKGL